MKASTITSSNEKVYELERVEGGCQTKELEVVFVKPMDLLTVSPEEIKQLENESRNGDLKEGEKEEEEEMIPLKSTPITDFAERGDIVNLESAIIEKSKLYMQKMNMVKARRKLRQEEEEDTKFRQESRDQKINQLLEDNANGIDTAKLTLDNLVCNFQTLSSQYNSKVKDVELMNRNEENSFFCK